MPIYLCIRLRFGPHAESADVCARTTPRPQCYANLIPDSDAGPDMVLITF
ncbi:hypothetical protein BDR07DRAFT_1390913 [Suillus spraguei]|nr:hypothetical protein BDR07DRAFT_1390913 [Suillus spraguei]